VLGYPIRKSPDQRQVGDSPRLNAASHVLHRLLMPRHPPCALKNLATKMLASTMQFTNNKQKPAHPAPRHPTPQSSHPTGRTGMTRDQPQNKKSEPTQPRTRKPTHLHTADSRQQQRKTQQIPISPRRETRPPPAGGGPENGPFPQDPTVCPTRPNPPARIPTPTTKVTGGTSRPGCPELVE
jgi:hypothetical protein